MPDRKKTVAVLALILLNIFMVTNAHSQGKNTKSGFGYVILEGNSMDIQELNTTLNRNGYTRFSDNFFGIGAGGHQIKNRFVLYDGYALLYFPRYKNSIVENTKYEISLSGFYGLWNIGYVIYENNYLKIFPLLGFGTGAMKMKIVERRSFDEILVNPKGSSTITKGISIFNFAVGAEKLFGKKEGKKSDRYLMLGIRLGYRYCPGEYDWEYALGGPDISLTGPYFLVMFGGGHESKL